MDEGQPPPMKIIKKSDAESSDFFYSSDSRSSLDEPDSPDIWPSKYSTLEAFKELTENKILKPYPSATVEVEIIEVRTSDFPATFCKQCDELLTESKLLEAIRVVKWQMLQSSMYDLTKEDPRLFQLITAVRSILKYGCYNGHVKQLSSTMVYLLRTFAICPEHNLRISVHNPSSSTEVGGIVANIGFQNEDQTYTVKRVKGYPDLSVVVEDDPHVFLAIGENKKKLRSWRFGSSNSSENEIGQLMLYLTAAHLRKLAENRKDIPLPILGLYMKDLKFQQVIADVAIAGCGNYNLSLYFDSDAVEISEGLVKSMKLLHTFLSLTKSQER